VSRLSVLSRPTAAVLLALAVAVPAAGHDSHAPPTAYHRWLPKQMWVMHHWVPFDETRLQELLGVGTRRIFTWLENDHRTLGDLARRRGVDTHGLAARLLEPRRGTVSDRQYRILLTRSRDMLTQGHLAQHVLFHVFHGGLLTHHFTSFFGVSKARWRVLRLRHFTPLQIARVGKREQNEVRRQVLEYFAMGAEHAVHRQATSQAEADFMLARQTRLTSCWLHSPLPEFDPNNPFGTPFGGHGPHSRGSRIGLIHPKHARGCWKGLFTG
jgi:hypothetical protein